MIFCGDPGLRTFGSPGLLAARREARATSSHCPRSDPNIWSLPRWAFAWLAGASIPAPTETIPSPLADGNESEYVHVGPLC